MRALLIMLLTVVAILAASAVSTAQEPARLALLIGNKGYTAKVGQLKNPHNDVDLVAAALTKLGFKVIVVKDATYKQMDTALKRYVADVRKAGKGALSFFYYSGHGVSNAENGLNYLIPVDVTDADDDKVWFESFQQNAIIDQLAKQASLATHYLVFDACRNELNLSGPNAKALGSDKGFVPVADTSGLLIAYATAPKRTASDVGDGGGPYARMLAEELIKPGVESVTMFRNVQIRVKQTIGQDPWLSFPSLPPVYLAGRPEVGPTSNTAQPPLSEAAQAWVYAKDTSDPAVVEDFIRRFGDTFYGNLARARWAELLTAKLSANATPAPSPLPPTVSTSTRDWKAKYPELVFAIVPSASAQAETERYAPFIDYLSKELGTNVRLRIAKDYADMIEGQKTSQIHIGYYGPSSFARALTAGTKIEAFAQDVNEDGSRGYYSVVWVKKDSPAGRIEDLKGKSLCLVDPNSTSGNNVPRYAMGLLGIDPDKYFSKVVYAGSHENAIIALQQGTCDAAFNWFNNDAESNLQRMVRKNMVKAEDYRLIFRSDQIVNSPMAVLADLPTNLKKAIRDAVLAVATKEPETFKKATEGKAKPWEPVDNKAYDVIIELNKFVDDLRRKKG